MKKILFILDHLKGGGAERITLELAEQLYHRGFNVYFLILDQHDVKMPVSFDVPVYYANINPKFFRAGMWRKRDYKLTNDECLTINRIINEVSPDKIIVGYWYGYFVAPALPKTIESIFWFHGQAFDLKRRVTKNLFRWYKEARRFYFEKKGFLNIVKEHKLIFVNDDLRKECLPFIDDKLLFTLPNGVNISKIQSLAGNQKEKKWDCIFVGRLSPEKQSEHAIQAFANSGLSGRMAIVGDGQMKEELIELCKQLNIFDRVDFLGWQENPYPFIQQSRALILSSKTEGSPLVILESLSLNTPVVAYHINSGISSQLNHNDLVQGLVNNQDLDDLTRKLSQIVKQPYTITDDDKKQLSIEMMTNRFIEIIR